MPLKDCIYLQQEEESISQAQPGIGHEEEDEVGALGVHEAAGQVVHYRDIPRLPGPDHDHDDQEEQDLRLLHVQFTSLLRKFLLHLIDFWSSCSLAPLDAASGLQRCHSTRQVKPSGAKQNKTKPRETN